MPSAVIYRLKSAWLREDKLIYVLELPPLVVYKHCTPQALTFFATDKWLDLFSLVLQSI